MDELLIPVFILFSLLALVLALALLLYAIPVRAAVTLVRMVDRREQVVVISWGGVAVRSSGAGTGRVTEVLVLGKTVLSHAGSMKPVGGPAKERGEDEIAAPSGTIPIGRLVRVVLAAIGPVGRFGSEFWRQGRFEGASGTVRLGLGDPVLTGELCGYYWASRFLFLASRIDIGLEPVFDRAVLELELTIRMRVEHPLRILFAGLRLVRDPAMKEVMDFAVQGRPEGAAS